MNITYKQAAHPCNLIKIKIVSTWKSGTIVDNQLRGITHQLHIEGMVPLAVGVPDLVNTGSLDGNVSTYRICLKNLLKKTIYL